MLQFVLLYFRAFPESAGNSLQHFCNLDRDSVLCSGRPARSDWATRSNTRRRWRRKRHRKFPIPLTKQNSSKLTGNKVLVEMTPYDRIYLPVQIIEWRRLSWCGPVPYSAENQA